MCRSQAQGGQRCVSHTKAALQTAKAAHEANPTADTFDRLQASRADYASTPQGYDALWGQRYYAQHQGRVADVEDLTRAMERGNEIRSRNLAVLNEVRVASGSPVERAAVLRRQAVRGPNNLTDATLTRLADDPDQGVRLELGRYRGNLPAAAIMKLINDRDLGVMDAVARRHDLSPEALAALGSSSDPAIRRATVSAKRGGSQWVRRPREHVLGLLEDPDASVRSAAVAAWGAMGISGRDGLGHYGQPKFERPSQEVIDRLLARSGPSARKKAVMVFVDGYDPALRR